MNILFIATNYAYPPDHGHNLRTFNILKGLAKSHRVHYVAFTKDKDDFWRVDALKEMCESVNLFMTGEDLHRVSEIVSLFLNIFSPYPYIAQKYYHKGMKRRIDEIMRNCKIDLVHFDLLHLARYAKQIDSVPKVLTEHNVESIRVWRLAKNSRNIFLKGYLYYQYKKLCKFERDACKKFDLCITVSKEDLEILKVMSPEGRFYVIPNGVDTEFF